MNYFHFSSFLQFLHYLLFLKRVLQKQKNKVLLIVFKLLNLFFFNEIKPGCQIIVPSELIIIILSLILNIYYPFKDYK